MNKYTTVICLVLLVLFTGCKKETLTEDYTNYVKLKVETPKIINTTTQGFDYELSGTIISPKRVSMIDYGFLVYDIMLGYEVPVRLGSGNLSGTVTTNLFLEGGQPLSINDLRFYIVLSNGDTIDNNGVIYFDPLAGGQPGFTSNTPDTIGMGSDIKLQVVANNPNPSRYTMTDYGVEFNEQSLYESKFGLAVMDTSIHNLVEPGFNNLPNNNAQETLSITLTGLYPAYPYTSKFYVIYFDNVTGQPIWIETNTIDFTRF